MQWCISWFTWSSPSRNISVVVEHEIKCRICSAHRYQLNLVRFLARLVFFPWQKHFAFLSKTSFFSILDCYTYTINLIKNATTQKSNPSGMAETTRIVMKVVLCGEYGVGKSALFRRFVHDSFVEVSDRASTLGFDHFEKSYTVDGREISVRLYW